MKYRLRFPMLLAAFVATATAARAQVDSLRVPILVYHSIHPWETGESALKRSMEVPPDSFEAQMSYLHERGIPVVSMAVFVDALEGKHALPPHAVVITFDDGWQNQYHHAFPILKRFGYTATVFVFTNAIGRNDRYYTWDQLREMQSAGLTIGSHTRYHPRIEKVHDPKELNAEIAGSRATLQKQLGSSVDFFAYPFGVSTPEVEAVVRSAGYRAARSFTGGPWNTAQNLWHLKSVPITGSLNRFREIVDPTFVAKHDTKAHKSATEARRHS